jgi:hypothetical protein
MKLAISKTGLNEQTLEIIKNVTTRYPIGSVIPKGEPSEGFIVTSISLTTPTDSNNEAFLIVRGSDGSIFRGVRVDVPLYKTGLNGDIFKCIGLSK